MERIVGALLRSSVVVEMLGRSFFESKLFGMKKLICSLLFGILLVAPLDAAAQFGAYTRTGFGLGGSGVLASNFSGVGTRVGYLVQPTFEVGGELFRQSADDVALTTVRAGPYLAFYPVRQEEGYPLSIMMRGSYNYVRFSGDRADEVVRNGGSDTGNRYRFEIGGFSTLGVSDSFSLLPYLGISYALRTEADVSDFRRELTGLNFRFAFQYETGTAASLVLAPTAFVGDDDKARFGLSGAVVF